MQMQTAQSPKLMSRVTNINCNHDNFCNLKSQKRCVSDVNQAFTKSIRITAKTTKFKESKIDNMRIFSPQNNNGPRVSHWMEKIRTLSENEISAAAYRSPQPKTSSNLDGLLVNKNFMSVDHPLITLKAKSKNSKESSDTDTKEKSEFTSPDKILASKATKCYEDRPIQSSLSRNEGNRKYTFFKRKVGSKIISEQSNSEGNTLDKTYDVAEENRKLKMENANLIRKVRKLEETIRVKEILWKKEYEDENIDQLQSKTNYHDGIRHQIHLKFKKKVEEQEKRHATEVDDMRRDFTEQIENLNEMLSEMGQTVNKLK